MNSSQNISQNCTRCPVCETSIKSMDLDSCPQCGSKLRVHSFLNNIEKVLNMIPNDPEQGGDFAKNSSPAAQTTPQTLDRPDRFSSRFAVAFLVGAVLLILPLSIALSKRLWESSTSNNVSKSLTSQVDRASNQQNDQDLRLIQLLQQTQQLALGEFQERQKLSDEVRSLKSQLDTVIKERDELKRRYSHSDASKTQLLQ